MASKPVLFVLALVQLTHGAVIQEDRGGRLSSTLAADELLGRHPEQPYDLLGYFEGSCLSRAGLVVGSNGKQSVPRCLGQGQIMSQPLQVMYIQDKLGRVTFKWWEQTATIQPAHGPAFMMAGGSDSSLSLKAFKPTQDPTAKCISATFSTFNATYRAAVKRVGANDVYREDGTYHTQTLELTQDCPSRDNLPLYCNQQYFNYRCICNRADPPAELLAELAAMGLSYNQQEGTAWH